MGTTSIAEIWQEVLGVPVQDDDDFFALGGQSLAAMEVVAAVRRRLGITVRVRVLLEHPVLSDFAGQLDRSGERSSDRS
ncbi:phosphopantetheine-binding protein [Streptomyces sp. BE147]|uniref:phosphopantetheine-binding protein n=1 Tax=Streptomyces sp. BE147 TaxID=3002524 RepID=UPI002E7747CB|nr:phosphopantetheine-binding protein [Streptomyces sp. BE147]MEE1739706.1 phosphopantetheine-binding protein [Streptomyces sp. BE147]